jgi:hypothetical protein
MSGTATRRLELSDVLIALYVVAFARQFFWPIPLPLLAWLCTLLAAAAVWLLHWRTKESGAERPPRCFWLLVALPLLCVYALRAALPDMAWDVLDYRIINGQRALSGWPVRADDFFPARWPFNPAPDMAMGISRYVLGYRLGTALNLAVALWVSLIVERLLRSAIRNAPLRCAAVLLVVATEHLLFLISNNMVDLLPIPLLLEAGWLTIAADEMPARQRIVRSGVYLGAALALKLTSAIVVVPLVLLLLYRIARRQIACTWGTAALAAAAATLPLLPYSAFMLWHTGNPVFPLANSVFQSPYWPIVDVHAYRWAPVADDPSFTHRPWWEFVFWPLVHPLRVPSTAGDLGPHLGRISIAFSAAAVCLVVRSIAPRVRMWSFVVVSGCALWSFGAGYLRYAIPLEIAGAVVALNVTAALWQRHNGYARTAAVAVLLALVVQSASSFLYASLWEWGSRPTFVQQPASHAAELRHLLRDRDARDYLTEGERELIGSADVWVNSSPMTAGPQVLLRPDAPQLCIYMPEFFETAQARERFAAAVRRAEGKRLVTLCMESWFDFCTAHIRRVGFSVGAVVPFRPLFFSADARMHTMFYMEVLPHGSGRQSFTVTRAAGALTDAELSTRLAWVETPPREVQAATQLPLRVVLTNVSPNTLPALGDSTGFGQFLVGNHWLASSGTTIVNDDGRAALPFDLGPGESIELLLTVTTPQAAGEYLLELDVLQEGIRWRGGETLRVPMRVR